MKELTAAEKKIMLVLWELQSATIKDIILKLEEPKPAYNTVSTIIRILETKGFVDHTPEGRGYRYHPIVSIDEYRKFGTRELINSFFKGKLSNLVSHFSKSEDLDINELEEILNELKKKSIIMKQLIFDIPYLLEANLYLLLSVLCIKLISEKTHYFRLVRTLTFLLPLLSLILPYINSIPSLHETYQTLSPITVSKDSGLMQLSEIPSELTWVSILNGAVIGIGMLLIVIEVFRLIRLFQSATHTHYKDHKIYLIDTPFTSFSFFNWIFISKNSMDDLAVIAEHELYHRKFYHSIDTLLLSLIKALFWYNPASWKLLQFSKEVHEFQVDKAMIHQASFDQQEYLQTIINHQFKTTNSMNLKAPFATGSVKNRVRKLSSNVKSNKNIIFLSLSVLLSTFVLIGCAKNDVAANQTTPVLKTEAQYGTSLKEFNAALGGNLKLPEKFLEMDDLDAKFLIDFTITKTGELTDIVFKESPFPELEPMITKAIEEVPNNWTPAKDTEGNTINSIITIPIRFTFN